MTRDLYMIITAALVYISYLSNFIVIYELCYGVASGTTQPHGVLFTTGQQKEMTTEWDKDSLIHDLQFLQDPQKVPHGTHVGNPRCRSIQ